MKAMEEQQQERRRFLQQAMAAGGAGVLLYLAGDDSDAGAQTGRGQRPDGAADAGYRLTEHIRSYYDTARS